MDFKGEVNRIRRIIMHNITKYVGQSDDVVNVNNLNINKILISRPNSRLGNQILITPVVQEISDIFPNSKIDLFVRGGAAVVIFENYNNIDQIIRLPQKPFKNLIQYLLVWVKLRRKNYDLAINIDNGSSSGKLSTQLVKSKIKIFGAVDNDLSLQKEDYIHIAKAPVYNLRKSLSKVMDIKEEKPIPPLSIRLNEEEKKRGKELLSQLVKNNKETICIYTYATGAKCYSKDWWTDLYNQLKEKYEPEYNIIEILPKENVSQIDFKASSSFYSRDIREMGALIANSILFIGADSGIMHLACSSGTPTIGLFSVSDLERYKPYGGKNTAIDTNNNTSKEIINIIDATLVSLHKISAEPLYN